MCARLQLQLSTQQQKERNNNIYITKRLSHFGKVTMSVGKIIEELLFGENEKKELICKHRRKSHAMLKSF